MATSLAALAAGLAGVLLHAAPETPRAPEASRPEALAGELRLRAHGADAATLLMFVFGESQRLLLATPGVGAPVTLDVARPALREVEEEVLRAAGAPFVALGQVVVVGDQARVDAARASPLRPLLEKGGSTARKVKLQFRGIALTSLLGLLADVGKRRFALAEGIAGKVVVATGGRPWTEVLDATLASADLARDLDEQVVRIRRRADRAPQFTPLEVILKEQQAEVRPPPPVQSRCAAPQGRYELGTIRLVATLTGGKGSQALLALPEDRPAVIQAGACIGTDGGRVVRVEPERLVVERPRPDGAAGTEQVSLEMPRG